MESSAVLPAMADAAAEAKPLLRRPDQILANALQDSHHF